MTNNPQQNDDAYLDGKNHPPRLSSEDDTSTNRGTESVRGTRPSEGEAGHHLASSAQDDHSTPSEPTPAQILERIATQAREYPDMAFTTLAHHLSVYFLRRAFQRLNKKGAAGIDRVTWQKYASNGISRIKDLHTRLVNREYKPQPVVRKWIPKSNGKLRPLGIPALEDKIVQRAVTDLLESIYEQDFHEFSYGFRSGRSAHQALRDIRLGLQTGINHVIDCDISSYFDNIQHDQLLDFVRKRVKDGSILALLKGWLKAGILDNRELIFPKKGSPQGSVISPLLANIYLHEVLDTWFVETVTKHCQGKVVLYRYADDFVIGCAQESDAQRIQTALVKRFAKYGLEINPDKTRMISFHRPPRNPSGKSSGPKPGTFNFLGFTHYWGKTRKGGYTIKWKTDRSRFNRFVRSIDEWCRKHRHQPLEYQHNVLCAKLRGHFQYYGITFNLRALERMEYRVTRIWRYWLARRGGRRKFTWKIFKRLSEAFPLPRPSIVHGYEKMGRR